MTAKEMFEDLGYRQYIDKTTFNYIKINEYDYRENKIDFFMNKTIGIEHDINLNELKAIQKQIEELGWKEVK